MPSRIRTTPNHRISWRSKNGACRPHRESHHGTTPATVVGAIRKKTADPRTAKPLVMMLLRPHKSQRARSRVAALEEEVARLKAQLAAVPSNVVALRRDAAVRAAAAAAAVAPAVLPSGQLGDHEGYR